MSNKTITRRMKQDAFNLIGTRHLSHDLCVKLLGWMEGEMKHRAQRGDRRHADTVFAEFIRSNETEIRNCELVTK